MVDKSKARDWNKKDYCFYCERSCSSYIPAHYINCHSDKDLVRAMVLETEKDKKSALRTKLVNLGNYKHNSKVRVHEKKPRSHLSPQYSYKSI
jgi:hypothetical protein